MSEAAFLKLIRDEIAATETELKSNPLFVRLRALRALLAAYEGKPGPSADVPAPRPAPVAAQSRPEAPEESDKDAALKIMRNADQLVPLTEKQLSVLIAVNSAAKKSSHNRALANAIKTLSGFSNVEDALGSLHHKGYILRRQEKDGTWHYPFPLIGVPRTEEAKNARQWSDEECTELVREMAAANERGVAPNWIKLGTFFSRTPQAVETKARSQNWYPGRPSGVFADQVLAEPHTEENSEADAAEQPETNVISPPPDEEDAEGELVGNEVDADDLSKNPREVLAIIVELHSDKIHPIKEPDILQVSEVDEGRLPFVLQRLRELRLVRRDSVGSLAPTARGMEIAAVIKEEEAA